MRKADRKLLAGPSALLDADSAGKKECELAILYHTALAAKKKKLPKKPNFSAYKLAMVTQILDRLFLGKCAYCESRYASTQPMDVEHYRPKNAVDEEKDHPGYYWLAADWDNLLPSCIDCNRRRQQVIVGEGKAPAGKATMFPLAPGAQRARKPGDSLSTEKPLLLNPCDDDPSEYLEFDDNALAKPTPARLADGRAKTSIAVYGLNRTGLVMAREEVLKLMMTRMSSIGSLTEILRSASTIKNPKIVTRLEDLLAFEIAELFRFREKGRPYSEMCRQRIEKFAKDLGVKS